MAVGSSIKQNYTLAFLSEQEMPVGGAIMIPVFNTIFNSANSIPSLTTAANAFTLSFLSTENDSGAAPPGNMFGSLLNWVAHRGHFGTTAQDFQE